MLFRYSQINFGLDALNITSLWTYVQTSAITQWSVFSRKYFWRQQEGQARLVVVFTIISIRGERQTSPQDRIYSERKGRLDNLL